MVETLKKSPLAPSNFPEIPPIDGICFASASSGIKYKGRTDLMLVHLCPGTTIAGVFSKSATRAAPVLDCQDKIGGQLNTSAAILVNSGNANAFTGQKGMEAVSDIVAEVSKQLSVNKERVFTSSTGVIGELLPSKQITRKIKDMARALSTTGIEQAAHAIMTTDTFAKGAYVELTINNKLVKIAGIAKGSGMISPDMATMLAYIFTDVKISQKDLQSILTDINSISFNAITVDSDTSTSDTVLLAATGRANVSVDKESKDFKHALHQVMRNLAHLVVKDGEGASKFVEVCVVGAQNCNEAKTHAFAIANSPLVKTALAGSDPNWGRIVMAIGKSGAAADRDKLKIYFGNILVAENGFVALSYTEKEGLAYMQRTNIKITVDLGLGLGCFTVWTCDMTHQYISINADYRS